MKAEANPKDGLRQVAAIGESVILVEASQAEIRQLVRVQTHAPSGFQGIAQQGDSFNVIRWHC